MNPLTDLPQIQIGETREKNGNELWFEILSWLGNKSKMVIYYKAWVNGGSNYEYPGQLRVLKLVPFYSFIFCIEFFVLILSEGKIFFIVKSWIWLTYSFYFVKKRKLFRKSYCIGKILKYKKLGSNLSFPP